MGFTAPGFKKLKTTWFHYLNTLYTKFNPNRSSTVEITSRSFCTPLSKGYVNPLAPIDVYIRRTAQLTSRRCILNIYSTNILTEYFKHAAHSPFFFLFKMPSIS